MKEAVVPEALTEEGVHSTKVINKFKGKEETKEFKWKTFQTLKKEVATELKLPRSLRFHRRTTMVVVQQHMTPLCTSRCIKQKSQEKIQKKKKEKERSRAERQSEKNQRRTRQKS